MIWLDRVSKGFGGHPVLSDVTFHAERGLTTVVMGPSGAGKSVLARLVVGLHRPDSGRVLIDGTDIGTLPDADLRAVRRRIGMCFQDGALFNSMSVGENVAFPLRRHTRLSEKEIWMAVASKLEQVGLPGTENRLPDELSGGMRKRVGIARAIALDPDILILDEPTSGLDPLMADAIDELIFAMKPHRTLLIISHDVTNVLAVADRVGVLIEHEMIAFGPAAEVIRSPIQIVRRFFDRATRTSALETLGP